MQPNCVAFFWKTTCSLKACLNFAFAAGSANRQRVMVKVRHAQSKKGQGKIPPLSTLLFL